MIKSFTKSELRATIIIFFLLIAVSAPNLVISFRRARDQARKVDMGNIQDILAQYSTDMNSFPLSSSDGRIVSCKRPEEKVELDKLGHLKINYIPCDWGKDAIRNFTPGSETTYISVLPRDPFYQKGVTYRYISDGKRIQIFIALEGRDEPEYDPKIVARGLMCGNVVCNAGKQIGCPVEKSVETCEEEALKNNI